MILQKELRRVSIMDNRFSVYMQKFIPQHLLSIFFGKLAHVQTPWMKNWMIRRFIRKYHVDMSLALNENPESYSDFNQFFIRQLKSDLRPLATAENEIVSPVDGMIAQVGKIRQDQLLQAKDFYYDLKTLLGDEKLASQFHDGSFATLYLAPFDYHRVHMPLTGKLIKSTYIPGKLFSVNRLTSEIIPQLFTRNERLIMTFDTAAGPMAVIMVGAMIVGNIETVWMEKPVRAKEVASSSPDIHLQKGAELGHFTLGSTVILLFGKDKVEWEGQADKKVIWGEKLGVLRKP